MAGVGPHRSQVHLVSASLPSLLLPAELRQHQRQPLLHPLLPQCRLLRQAFILSPAEEAAVRIQPQKQGLDKGPRRLYKIGRSAFRSKSMSFVKVSRCYSSSAKFLRMRRSGAPVPLSSVPTPRS